jgi:2-polyprenyl-6-methoxyphenol hydroxylase-like FAD-dependent oxidoreductase
MMPCAPYAGGQKEAEPVSGLRAVVAADGIGSQTRKAIFPEHPGLRYAAFTTWRFLADPIPELLAAATPGRVLRNTTLLLVGELMPNASLRSLDRIYDRQPPGRQNVGS